MVDPVYITPEKALRAVPEVQEINASVEVPVVNGGDPEVVDIYVGRETRRPEGSALPENNHAELRARELSASKINTWYNFGMLDYAPTPAEKAELDGLYE